MNLQLHHVISDIVGQTGLAIVDAILVGQRNLSVLAKLRHERFKASEEVSAKSLVGDYRAEHLFTLRQSLDAYRSYQKMIEDCDREVRRYLDEFQPPQSPLDADDDNAKPPVKKALRRRNLTNSVRRNWPDFTKFRSAAAFASWMGLCQDNGHQRRQGSLGRHA